jgi:hypothetical protein
MDREPSLADLSGENSRRRCRASSRRAGPDRSRDTRQRRTGVADISLRPHQFSLEIFDGDAEDDIAAQRLYTHSARPPVYVHRSFLGLHL